jgi:hypothetical protein
VKSLLLLLSVVSAAVLAGDPESAKTDWFVASKYGVFVHYLVGLQNNPDHVASLGRQTSRDDCVREFDAEKFADRIREAVAGYVIFTMMQRSRFLIAPNATFDRLTGYCPRRPALAPVPSRVGCRKGKWDPVKNRQGSLAGRPKGLPKESDFRLVETGSTESGKRPFLMRTNYVSADPHVRRRISEIK